MNYKHFSNMQNPEQQSPKTTLDKSPRYQAFSKNKDGGNSHRYAG